MKTSVTLTLLTTVVVTELPNSEEPKNSKLPENPSLIISTLVLPLTYQ